MNKTAKLGLVASLFAGAALAPAAATADDGRVHYNGGTRIEFADFDLKLNVQLQPRYSYTDTDVENRTNNGVAAGVDSSSFDQRRSRLVLSGNTHGQEFSYKLQYDFASAAGGGELKDAYLKWNTSDTLGITFGQFKQPIGREQRVSSQNLYFTERSRNSNGYTTGRAQGAMASLALSDTANLNIAINNGESTGEGQNLPGADNKVQAVFGFDWECGNFGSRGVQGDFRENGDLGVTAGASVAYGEGTNALGDFDKTDVTVDAAVRTGGLEVGAEYFRTETEVDGIATEPEDTGFDVLALYNISDNLGTGLRFGYTDPDSTVEGIAVDDITEYSFVINYFLDGHSLKLQNNFTFEVISPDAGSDDITDFRYDLQLSAYF